MGSLFTYLIAGIIVIAIAAVLLVLMGKKSPSSSSDPSNSIKKGPKHTKSQGQIIKEASKRLSRNPDDPAGLIPLGEVYYQNQLWDKAFPIYQNLSRLAPISDKIDKLMANLRAGEIALKLNANEEAIKFLSLAYAQDSQNVDVNKNLGLAYYRLNNLEKAVPCFKKTLMIDPLSEKAFGYLAMALYKQHHYRESLNYFKKAITEDPSNKEILFHYAQAMAEDGHGDKAVQIFSHLRADTEYGPTSCLHAGIYHSNQGNKEAAIQDFMIGLKHQNITDEVKIEIQYRLALCHLELNKLQEGLSLLRQIRSVNPNYKDVNGLLARYQELGQNQNLQVYLSGPASEFVVLCRKIVAVFYERGIAKIVDIKVAASYVDIIADIDTPKWEDTEMFRFFRTTGTTGEIFVREFLDMLHDKKAGRGTCFTAGNFSDDAIKYADGRPVDLIERAGLTKILKKIN
ncbi:MAG: tetratricopeptide repeat protein [Treponema sp.]|nr:tetratricopeptide repeat protein [Treponema sp.]